MIKISFPKLQIKTKIWKQVDWVFVAMNLKISFSNQICLDNTWTCPYLIHFSATFPPLCCSNFLFPQSPIFFHILYSNVK